MARSGVQFDFGDGRGDIKYFTAKFALTLPDDEAVYKGEIRLYPEDAEKTAESLRGAYGRLIEGFEQPFDTGARASVKFFWFSSGRTKPAFGDALRVARQVVGILGEWRRRTGLMTTLVFEKVAFRFVVDDRAIIPTFLEAIRRLWPVNVNIPEVTEFVEAGGPEVPYEATAADIAVVPMSMGAAIEAELRRTTEFSGAASPVLSGRASPAIQAMPSPRPRRDVCQIL